MNAWAHRFLRHRGGNDARAIMAQRLPIGQPEAAQTRLVIQEELLALWERRRPLVLYVTHDIEEALLLADRLGGPRRRYA